MEEKLRRAIDVLKGAKRVCAFTGAGISVESGIPPFRGKDGLWSKFDPIILDINYFLRNPDKSWRLIKQIFYDFFGKARPNPGHYALAELERKQVVRAIITQNIDNLHQEAGSKVVYEFHGNSRDLVCIDCARKFPAREKVGADLPPRCDNCGGLLKPDFVFFGEPIPEPARSLSSKEAEISDVFLVIGTTGEIQPASMIPFLAKQNMAFIIEVNIEESNYTRSITDVFLRGKASEVLSVIVGEI